MIVQALYEYLTDPTNITGGGARTFATPQTVGSETVRDRDEAKRVFRSIVGNQIYASRLPRGAWHTAVTLRLVSVSHDYVTIGGTLDADSVLELNVFAKGDHAQARASKAGTLARLAIESFNGVWGTEHQVTVYDVTTEREQERATAPTDGDDWIFNYGLDFNVWFAQATAI